MSKSAHKENKWITAQKKHFDLEVKSYSSMYGKETPFHSAITERFLNFAGTCPNQRVLDIGCGFGRTTLPLLEIGCKVTALDISRPTLELLKKKVKRRSLSKNFRTLLLSVEDICFQKKFDVVVGRGVLHHLEQPVLVLSKVYDSLLPGGKAVFMDPNPLQPAWIVYTSFHPTLSWSVEKHLLRGIPSKSCSMLKAAGFKNVKYGFVGIVPPPLLGKINLFSEIEKWMATFPVIRAFALYLMISGEKPEE